MRPILLFPFIIVAAAVAGCGASDLPSSSDVVVTIPPSYISVRSGGTVDLQGTVTGLSDLSIGFWIEEGSGIDSPTCDIRNPDWMVGCRFGYIIGRPYSAASAVTTYHAPPISGTYHVRFTAMQMSRVVFAQLFEKHATATIVVTD